MISIESCSFRIRDLIRDYTFWTTGILHPRRKYSSLSPPSLLSNRFRRFSSGLKRPERTVNTEYRINFINTDGYICLLEHLSSVISQPTQNESFFCEYEFNVAC